SVDMDGLLKDLRMLVEPAPAAFEESFRGPPLPANAANAESCLRDARALAQRLDIPVGDAVDFWTEVRCFRKPVARLSCTGRATLRRRTAPTSGWRWMNSKPQHERICESRRNRHEQFCPRNCGFGVGRHHAIPPEVASGGPRVRMRSAAHARSSST